MKKRLKRIAYTFKHKIAFLQTQKKLCGKNNLRGYLHDLDKLLMYVFYWHLPLKKISERHRLNNAHHVRSGLKKTREDLIETVIDWECARLTKPDKQLNAYETLQKFYPAYSNVYLPIIKELLPEQII
ncbi:MAG: hypothetical protein R3Y43_04710 [Alphaproteobacteria bacterium]